MKPCSTCRTAKTLDEFSADRSKKDGKQSTCKACSNEKKRAYHEVNKEAISERKRAYYEVNREAISERSRAYREGNKEAISEQKRAYYEVNREAVSEKQRAYYEVNREAVSEKQRAYREGNKEAIKERSRKWLAANPESRKATRHRRRSAKTDLPPNTHLITTEEIKQLFIDMPLCCKCGSSDRLELDHVQPVFLGGKSILSNYQVLCKSCNCSKSATFVDYR